MDNKNFHDPKSEGNPNSEEGYWRRGPDIENHLEKIFYQ